MSCTHVSGLLNGTLQQEISFTLKKDSPAGDFRLERFFQSHERRGFGRGGPAGDECRTGHGRAAEPEVGL